MYIWYESQCFNEIDTTFNSTYNKRSETNYIVLGINYLNKQET